MNHKDLTCQEIEYIGSAENLDYYRARKDIYTISESEKGDLETRRGTLFSYDGSVRDPQLGEWFHYTPGTGKAWIHKSTLAWSGSADPILQEVDYYPNEPLDYIVEYLESNI